MGFDRQDLLRQTGYSEGDLLPVQVLNFSYNTAFSTSSTSFTSPGGATSRPRLDFDQFSVGDSYRVYGTADIKVTDSAETVSIRLEVGNETTTPVSRTGDTSFNTVTTGPDPVDLVGKRPVELQLKSSDGGTTVRVRRGTVTVAALL